MIDSPSDTVGHVPAPSRFRPSWGEIATAVILVGFMIVLGSRAVGGVQRINDFHVFYQGALWAWENSPLLFTESDRQERHFLYPPTGAFLLIPICWLPHDPAGHVFTALRLIALLAISGAVLRLARGEGWFDIRRDGWWVVLAGFAVCGRSLLSEFGNGQINVILLALSLTGVWLTLRDRWPAAVAGGTLIALAGLVKGTPFLFAGIPLLHRRWRAVGSVVIATALALLASRVWFGAENNALHWAEFRDRSQRMAAERAEKGRVITVPELLVSASATTSDPIGADTVNGWILGQAIVLGAMFLGIRWLRARTGWAPRPSWDAAACAIGMILVSPVARKAHLTLALPTVMVLAAMLRAAPAGGCRMAAIVAAVVGDVLIVAGESLPLDRLIPAVDYNITLLLGVLSLAVALSLVPAPGRTGVATLGEDLAKA